MINKDSILKKLPKAEDKLLAAKILDKIHKCEKIRSTTYSDFLDPYQKNLIEKILADFDDLNFSFNGGYSEAERVVVFFNPDLSDYDDDDFEYPFKAVEVTFNSRESLSHRDYLGSLLGLGIKREKMGDILVKESSCNIIVLEEIADFIAYNLTKVGNTKVSVALKDIDELQMPEPKVKEIKSTVASLRLDCISSAGYGISRSKISDYIRAEKVNLNWETTTSPTKQVKEGDTISLRGKGRVVVEKIGPTTRKGRIGVVLRKLI